MSEQCVLRTRDTNGKNCKRTSLRPPPASPPPSRPLAWSLHSASRSGLLPSWAPSLPGSPAVTRVARRRARSLPASVCSAAQQWSRCPGAGPGSEWKAAGLGTGERPGSQAGAQGGGDHRGSLTQGLKGLGFSGKWPGVGPRGGASVTPCPAALRRRGVVGERESWVTLGAQGLDGLPRGVHAVYRLRSGFVPCGLDVGTRVSGWSRWAPAVLPCPSLPLPPLSVLPWLALERNLECSPPQLNSRLGLNSAFPTSRNLSRSPHPEATTRPRDTRPRLPAGVTVSGTGRDF